MTHPTDEELGARLRVGVPTMWEKQAADRIEALMKDRDQAWEVAHAATDRGMRAEAALAAQIEVAAWQPIETAPRDGSWFVARTKFGTIRVVHYADCADRYPIAHDDKAWSTAPTEWMPISFRAQPHDRTALDRMLAEAREQALRDAADEMEDERAKQAILALIEKP